MKDILVRIRNSFMPVDFVVLKMDVCRQIPLILGRPFLSTTGATIDVAARIIKLNISRKEETFTFKPKGTKKCNQVMIMIRPDLPKRCIKESWPRRRKKKSVIIGLSIYGS
jgi:hypothetical protein